eukprot:365123-Rhodomonas_salina.1
MAAARLAAKGKEKAAATAAGTKEGDEEFVIKRGRFGTVFKGRFVRLGRHYGRGVLLLAHARHRGLGRILRGHVPRGQPGRRVIARLTGTPQGKKGGADGSPPGG